MIAQIIYCLRFSFTNIYKPFVLCSLRCRRIKPLYSIPGFSSSATQSSTLQKSDNSIRLLLLSAVVQLQFDCSAELYMYCKRNLSLRTYKNYCPAARQKAKDKVSMFTDNHVLSHCVCIIRYIQKFEQLHPEILCLVFLPFLEKKSKPRGNMDETWNLMYLILEKYSNKAAL